MKAALIRYTILFLLFAVAVAVLLLMIGGDSYIIAQQGTDATPVPIGAYKVSMQFAVLAVIGFIAAILVLWNVLRFLLDLPTRIRTGASRRKRGQALEAMEDAMIAASAGDADKARKKAARAKALIDRPALGSIVAAQAAEVAGDTSEAKSHYEAMLGDARTRRVGLRGLAQLASSRGDHSAAMDYAQKACTDDPNCLWAFDTLFAGYVSDGNWDAALKTLTSGGKNKGLPKEVAARRATALKIAQAADLSAAGDKQKARALAVEAATDDPAFAPGAALAAQLLVSTGDADKAAKLLEKAWSKAPHPALALAYRDLADDETPKARAKRMRGLTKQNKDHRESKLVQIEEDLRAGDGVAAWSHLSQMLKSETPSARLCELAATAETQLNNPSDARLWLARAASAADEPDWSDLDPAGKGFAYTADDWKRLIFSYGDEGTLIHPRHERYQAVRPALGADGIAHQDDEKGEDYSELKDQLDKLSAPDDDGDVIEDIVAPKE